jgi:hypothetical protein
MRRADGRLVFLGRMDHQVKIRGHRIELGEIEAALEEIEGIEAAVTHVWTDDEGTSDRLVAYLRGPNGIPRADTLRSHLAQRLPDVMIPQEYIELAEFPLTPNRKVDRKRLPRPEVRKRTSGEGADAPRSMSDLQRLIGSVWADALGVDQVGLDDNFFDLGGHSLLTVRVHGRLSGSMASPSPSPTSSATPRYGPSPGTWSRRRIPPRRSPGLSIVRRPAGVPWVSGDAGGSHEWRRDTESGDGHRRGGHGVPLSRCTECGGVLAEPP